MFRTTTISVLALTSVGIMSAGQIQLGGANGLTNSYITTGTPCGGPTTCVTGSTATATEKNYDTVLFSGANIASQPSSPTITDTTNNITFSMINDGVGAGGKNNVWVLPQDFSSLPTMTIPVGVLDVTSVWTMINDIAGASGPGREATLLFNFGTTATATTTDTIKVELVNSTNSSTPSGQTRNAVDCTAPVNSPCGVTTNPPTIGPAIGPLAVSSTAITTNNNALIPSVTVLTNNLFSASYTSATGLLAGTSGNVNLDDQGIFFNNIALAALGAGDTTANTYLVSIGVREVGGMETSTADVGLSAITVVSTPEPSTVFLFLAGLGTIGLVRYRRKA